MQRLSPKIIALAYITIFSILNSCASQPLSSPSKLTKKKPSAKTLAFKPENKTKTGPLIEDLETSVMPSPRAAIPTPTFSSKHDYSVTIEPTRIFQARVFCEYHEIKIKESDPSQKLSEPVRVAIGNEDTNKTFEVYKSDYGTWVTRSHNLFLALREECAAQIKINGLLPSLTIELDKIQAGLGSPLFDSQYHEMVEKEYPAIKRSQENNLKIYMHRTQYKRIFDAKNPAYPNYDKVEGGEFHEDGGGELLSAMQLLYLRNGASPYVDYIAVDGPGSGNIFLTNLHGTIDNKPTFLLSSRHRDQVGTAIGMGTTENLTHIISHLKGETTNPAMHETMLRVGKKMRAIGGVSILSWSRGAITSIELSAKMYHDIRLKNISVRIMALDPVPGAGHTTLNTWDDINALLPNTKLYVGIYSRFEKSFGFTASIPREANAEGQLLDTRARSIIFEMPCNHGIPAGNIWNSKDRKKTTSGHSRTFAIQARIYRGMAQIFLAEGNTFSAALPGIFYDIGSPISREEAQSRMLQDFNHLLDNYKDFPPLGKESYIRPGGVSVHSLWKHRKYFLPPLNPPASNTERLLRIVNPDTTGVNIPGFLRSGDETRRGLRKTRTRINHYQTYLENLDLSSHNFFPESGYYESVK